MKNKNDLIKGLKILRYEEEMLNETFKELEYNNRCNQNNIPAVMCSSGTTVKRPSLYLSGYSKHIHNSILESFLIHIRILYEFLYYKRNAPTRDADILAEDYYEFSDKWHTIIGENSSDFKKTKDDIDKWLAHMSLIREETEFDKLWDCSKLYEWIKSGLKLFHENIPKV
jgi:hypothetical protein